MELEQVMLSETLNAEKTDPKNGAINCDIDSASTSSCQGSEELVESHRSESAMMLEMGVPRSDSADKKLSWLRSQIIGGHAEFDSPIGKRRLTYADHTASGRCLHFIEKYIVNNVLPYYGNTHTSDSYVGQQTTKMVHEASAYIKKQLGGGQDDAILFCGSGSTAAIKRLQEVMGIAVPSTMRQRLFKSLAIEERWVVFVGPYEHHSNLLSWRQSLAEVLEIGLDDEGLLDMEALRLQLESYQYANRPMLGSFSACSNVTGIYSNTRALTTLLHQYGAFACFDFAASGPYVEIDMRSGAVDGYDAVYLSPHKFLGGPGSPGILVISKALYRLSSCPPSTCGGGTVDFVNGFSEEDTLYADEIEERENAGSPPIIQKTRAALAFWVKEYVGFQVIEKLEHNYIERALKRLLPNENIEILGNTRAKRQAILSFLVYSTTNSAFTDVNNERNMDGREGRLHMWRETGNQRDRPLHGPFVAKLLNDLFGIQARGGCACAGPYGHSLLDVNETQSLAFKSAIQKGYAGVKPGWTRISFPYYMSDEDLEFILAAIEFIAIYGQRFLPLYHFYWKSGNWTFKEEAFMETLVGKENKLKFGDLPMANAMKGLNLDTDISQEHKNADVGDVGMIDEYASYLDTAKQIACLLPKFPPQRRVPKDLDHRVLLVRV